MEARHVRPILFTLLCLLCTLSAQSTTREREIEISALSKDPVSFKSEVDESGTFTWWLPADASEYILPIAAGIAVDPSQPKVMRWLRKSSPWDLSDLPALGARYGDQMAVWIVPHPHYAQLIVEDRIGVRFSFPRGRHNATPCEIVATRGGSDALEVARIFREWRKSSPDTGSIPKPRPLTEKAKALPRVSRLFGTPHIYLWGTSIFSQHDVPRRKWTSFARALRDAPRDSPGGRIVSQFKNDQLKSLQELAAADWASPQLITDVAAALSQVLANPSLQNPPAKTPPNDALRQNKAAFAAAFSDFLSPPESWGDGLSLPMLDALESAGLDRALLLLSDLYGTAAHPDLARRTEELGYLLGPYDSYHSVHAPDAAADTTWETAQFDATAFEQGRVLNIDGSGHAGFRGKGFHFSPAAAWPYVQKRVGGILNRTPYCAWFVDCDATAECFDDYRPGREATRPDDVKARRSRLRWLESEHKLVVGSEGGSALFADVIHFGHGVTTPYLGHLDPSFRDRNSPHFLGRHWPADRPEMFFKAIPVPPALRTPYFDPTVRVPLYQAALGDEIIVSHHWNFDSFKFDDVAITRELLEILHNVPPMYHLNRETWPERKDRIVRHFAFWSPIHRQLATAPLVGFKYLSNDRQVQQTTFRTAEGDVTIAVNFSNRPQTNHPPYSATVSGPIKLPERVYVAKQP
jgi:hypothetical protein